ncbi:MAG: CoxG family protein [Sulfobacillus sp.]
MEMAGEMRLAADPDRAFNALLDPDVLARAIPGCKSFQQQTAGRYQLTAELGVAGVGGRYQGTLAVIDPQPPHSMRLQLELTGGPGSVSATILVSLEPEDAGTRVTYHGVSEIGGKLAGIGQRMLDGVAKMLERQFMNRLAQEVADHVGGLEQGRTTS